MLFWLRTYSTWFVLVDPTAARDDSWMIISLVDGECAVVFWCLFFELFVSRSSPNVYTDGHVDGVPQEECLSLTRVPGGRPFHTALVYLLPLYTLPMNTTKIGGFWCCHKPCGSELILLLQKFPPQV